MPSAAPEIIHAFGATLIVTGEWKISTTVERKGPDGKVRHEPLEYMVVEVREVKRDPVGA